MADRRVSKKRRKRLLARELLKAGLLTKGQFKRAIRQWKKVKDKTNERIGEIIIKAGILDEATLLKFLEQYLGVPYISLKEKDSVDLSVLKLIPEDMARNFNVLAVRVNEKNNNLAVAMSNPLDLIALDTLRAKTGYQIERYFSQPKEIANAINRYYEESGLQKSISEFVRQRKEAEKEFDIVTTFENLESQAGETPVVEFVDQLLRNAVRRGASDIHVEPRLDSLSIRYRIDGVLRSVIPPPKKMQSAIITRLKLMSHMDIAEQRLPQDGRFNFLYNKRRIDVRVASSPIVHGEQLVMRLLDKSTLMVKMEDLGLEEKDLENFKTILHYPHALILVTGPTGSGKTTTLYSALSYINKPEKKIVTVEDPVEYQIGGINQIQAKHSIGLTFANGLRAILRQDPDIIMIGEVRDLETLENAIKASLTGHLVLSTIHTNDAPSVIFRLIHMGMKPYLISSSLSLVIAQRLVRRICEQCKEKTEPQPLLIKEIEKRAKMSLGHINFFKGRGCPVCEYTGYKGRVGLFEVFLVSKTIKDMIIKHPPESEVKRIAMEEGMKTIFQCGMEKVNQGVTSLDEVLGVTVF